MLKLFHGRTLPDDPSAMLANASPAFDASARSRLLQIQLSSIYGHVSKAAFISTLFAFALVVYMTPVFGMAATHAWFAMKATVAAGRFGLAQAYRAERFRANATLADRLMLASLALDGGIWGFACVWGMNAPSEVVSLLVACLCSVAMLATFGLQVRLLATAAYVVPMLLPVAVALAWRGDTLGIFGACGTLLVVMQALVTGLASERRLKREFMAHEDTARALQERSEALLLASRAKVELEHALDQVKRQSAIKALFLGTMSHELRTPLHGILGLTELVQRQIADPVVKHRLSLIESSGTHLLELIGALLDVSRIDAGRLVLHDAPFDLTAEVRNLADLYELRCNAKGIVFKSLVEIPRVCWVLGDAARVRQVLHNLLGNALKFTERGLVRFRVRERSGVFIFEVADTGPGIAPPDLAHIFEAFRQVDETAVRPADGTGLGLTIARELAQAMGGDIDVNSALDVGSRFAFTARLALLPEAQIPVDKRPDADPVRQLRPGYRVLLVEDNDVNALIANAYLERVGAQVTRSVDGKKAVLAAFADPRPDLILMDCRMPIMDGPAATREIRAIERSSAIEPAPIIALTATPSDEDRKECFDSGMNGFLTKPFTLAQLMNAISVCAAAVAENRMNEHPMYDFAKSLDDMEPDLFSGGITVH